MVLGTVERGCVWTGLEDLRPLIEKVYRRRCRDTHDLDDLVQESFLRAARYRHSLEDGERLPAWVLSIAGNVFRNHLRQEGRAPRQEVEPEVLERTEGREPAPGEAGGAMVVDLAEGCFDEAELMLHLPEALRQLGRREQGMIDAFYARGFTCRETAEEFELEPQLMKVRLFRLRQRLRKAILQRLRQRRIELLLEQGVEV